jgi:hypothetical protein
MRYFLIAAVLMLLSVSFLSLNANQNVSSAINSTRSLIDRVNQSGYLIFYPNMTLADKFLNEAEMSNNSTETYILLDNATNAAREQEISIYKYRGISFIIMVALAVASLIILLVFVVPKQKNAKINKFKKRQFKNK